MGHSVTGIIARPEVLGPFAASRSLLAPVPMSAGFAMLPLRDRELDTILPLPLTGKTAGFVYLSDQLVSLLAELSREATVMYFETEYFGGVGTQGAVVFQNGVA